MLRLNAIARLLPTGKCLCEPSNANFPNYNRCRSIFTSASLCRPDAKTGKQVADTRRVQRSVLEEVLIKEEQAPKTTAQKVKKKAENTFLYLALAGSVVTLGGISYLLFDYFFAASSPQRIYSKALARIRDDPECVAVLGPNIAGFGEQSRRSRRHIASHNYEAPGGEKRVRVTFHVKGELGAGRAQVEMAQKPGESWDYRYLFVEMAHHGGNVILIDNRQAS